MIKISGSFPLYFYDLKHSAKSIWGEGEFPAKFQVRIPKIYSLTCENSCSFFMSWFSRSIFAYEVDKLCLESIKSMHSYQSSSLLERVFL